MSAPGEPAGHRDYEDMAVAHVLGGLDEDQGRLFRAHLLECQDCRARVGELRAIASDLAGVERSARRERQEEAGAALDTKRRDADQDEAPAVVEAPRRLMAPAVAVVGLLVFVVGLSVYVFVLRSQVAGLEQEVADRTAAAAVLEHGDDVTLTYEAPDVSATVRADGREVAVVVDGLEDAGRYAVSLIDPDADGPRTAPAEVVDGRLFMLVERRDGDEALRVHRADDESVVEADLTD